MLTVTGVALDSATMSDIRSAITAGGDPSVLSDILSAAQQANSRALVVQSRVSDVESALDSQFAYLSNTLSNLDADVGAVGDIASDAHSAAAQANSRILVGQSTLSNIYDLLSDVDSALTSQFTYTSNALSNLDADVANLSGVVSDFYSDFQSRVPGLVLTRAQTMTELAAVPAASPTLESAIMFLYQAQRNRTRRDNTSVTIEDDAGAVVASALITYDGVGSLFTRGEFA
jgi:hypothetical protein